MLYKLSVYQVALIEELEMAFGDGLHVFTGETGAGKSIILDALNLVLGERADRDLIRTGAERAWVEAVFIINENSFVSSLLQQFEIEPDENQLILYREITISGRNTCKINGRTVPQSLLRQISSQLLDIHGQHEHQSLLEAKNHLSYLDGFGGQKIALLSNNVSGFYKSWVQIKKQLEQKFGNDNEREQRMDLLSYQINEIEQAELKLGEEEECIKIRELQRNDEKISSVLGQAYQSVYDNDSSQQASKSVLEETGKVLRAFDEIAKFEPLFEELQKRIGEVYYQLEDITLLLREHRDKYDFDPLALEQTEQRLDLIHKLKRKYGASIADILAFQNSAQDKMNELLNAKTAITALEAQRDDLFKQLCSACEKLSQERHVAAKVFEQNVRSQLSDLGMAKALFSVQFNEVNQHDDDIKNKISDYGWDDVEFLLSPNLGEPPKSLARIASGGELSRIMLSIKNVNANADDIQTLIFDEIDVGISGKIAQAVSQKLYQIAKSKQVICVTHLQQIAAMADIHYLVEKSTKENRTFTTVKTLSSEERIYEIARLTSGSHISEISIEHAKELLLHAKQI